MRRFLLEQLDISIGSIKPIIISGRTGTGKTVLLQKLSSKIDLEGIFHHRGSVFGIHATPQPAQIDIENDLSIQLMKFRHQGITSLAFEDESANIGSRRIPEKLFALLKASPLVVLQASVDERTDITFSEYITSALGEYQQLHGKDEGFGAWSQYLLTSIDKIRKRLGGERHKKLRSIMQQAITEHRQSGETGTHREWISVLLTEYYDPMYDYQLEKKMDRLEFQGTQAEIINHLQKNYSIQ